MRLFRAKGVKLPQDINLMPTLLAINALTITWIKVHHPQSQEAMAKGAELRHPLQSL